MKEELFNFPKIEKSLRDFLNDEDGNIARNKLVSIGSMVLLMSLFCADRVAAHESHVSHVSHSSHSSHVSHSDHGSHSSHNSHASHSNSGPGVGSSGSTGSAGSSVSTAPEVSEIPQSFETPQENTQILDLNGENEIVIDDTLESTSSLIKIDLPDVPKIKPVNSIEKTGLEFDDSMIENIASVAIAASGVGSVIAGTVGAANIGIDKVKEKIRGRKLKQRPQVYSNAVVEERVEALKHESNLEIHKSCLADLINEPASKGLETEIEETVERIDSLQKAVLKYPDMKDSISRFTRYFIPETIGIIMTYIHYVRDDAPESDIETILNKARKSINALNDAMTENVNCIYQHTTMDAVAKAEALQMILSQNGYNSEESKGEIVEGDCDNE